MKMYRAVGAECFCRNLKKYRKAKKMTQEVLAVVTGYHRTHISGLERGKINPTLCTILNLAGALEIEPCYLLIDTKRIGRRHREDL